MNITEVLSQYKEKIIGGEYKILNPSILDLMISDKECRDELTNKGKLIKKHGATWAIYMEQSLKGIPAIVTGGDDCINLQRNVKYGEEIPSIGIQGSKAYVEMCKLTGGDYYMGFSYSNYSKGNAEKPEFNLEEIIKSYIEEEDVMGRGDGKFKPQKDNKDVKENITEEVKDPTTEVNEETSTEVNETEVTGGTIPSIDITNLNVNEDNINDVLKKANEQEQVDSNMPKTATSEFDTPVTGNQSGTTPNTKVNIPSADKTEKKEKKDKTAQKLAVSTLFYEKKNAGVKFKEEFTKDGVDYIMGRSTVYIKDPKDGTPRRVETPSSVVYFDKDVDYYKLKDNKERNISVIKTPEELKAIEALNKEISDLRTEDLKKFRTTIKEKSDTVNDVNLRIMFTETARVLGTIVRYAKANVLSVTTERARTPEGSFKPVDSAMPEDKKKIMSAQRAKDADFTFCKVIGKIKPTMKQYGTPLGFFVRVSKDIMGLNLNKVEKGSISTTFSIEALAKRLGTMLEKNITEENYKTELDKTVVVFSKEQFITLISNHCTEDSLSIKESSDYYVDAQGNSQAGALKLSFDLKYVKDSKGELERKYVNKITTTRSDKDNRRVVHDRAVAPLFRDVRVPLTEMLKPEIADDLNNSYFYDAAYKRIGKSNRVLMDSIENEEGKKPEERSIRIVDGKIVSKYFVPNAVPNAELFKVYKGDKVLGTIEDIAIKKVTASDKPNDISASYVPDLAGKKLSIKRNSISIVEDQSTPGHPFDDVSVNKFANKIGIKQNNLLPSEVVTSLTKSNSNRKGGDREKTETTLSILKFLRADDDLRKENSLGADFSLALTRGAKVTKPDSEIGIN